MKWGIINGASSFIILTVLFIGTYLVVEESDCYQRNILVYYFKGWLILLGVLALSFLVLFISSGRGSRNAYCDVTINGITTRYTKYDYRISFGYRSNKLFLQGIGDKSDLNISSDYVCNFTH